MQQLTLPGIECVPGKVRRHGLREFHTYPLVSPGKDAAGVWGGSWRVSADRGLDVSGAGARAYGQQHPGACCSIWTATRPTGWSTYLSPAAAPAELDHLAPKRTCTPMSSTP